MKFQVKYDMAERGLPTLFKWQYFTVDAEQRKNWDYEHLEQYLTEYRLAVSGQVLAQYQDDPTITEILQGLQETESSFVVSNNKAERYGGKKQYIKCRVPMFVLNAFKNLFISTLVYDAAGKQPPEGEAITFSFDTGDKTVTIQDIVLYKPADDPYFIYARNAVSTLSVEAIGLEQYNMEKGGEIKDFYDRRKMSGWKKREKLEKDKSIEDKAGIYMLYDEVRNELYVGKAISLKSRIEQHGNNPDDPAYHFTHYRYSVIAGEYYEFLYLIENAAIHDIAWILDMPAAETYTPSLSKKFDLRGCKVVNRVEHQTRRQN